MELRGSNQLRVIVVSLTIYLSELQDGFQAQRVIEDWINFYNTERPHSALEHRTPVEAYWANKNEKRAA
jgi:putative transposase